jgi:lipopolysaccharide transport system ATP-binding protein
MSSEVLIRAENLSKKFCRSLKRSLFYGLQDMAGELVGADGGHHGLRDQEFWAVNDVSFELRRGECLGLIGHNGAGKTTLLKMLNGLIKPDRGRIEMRGHVGALIALGAGFNPILTGRENIYVNASILGLTKRQIDATIDDVIDFADIREFIDTPVQAYSSGMQVRLGFAVATTLRPDVLILDEVLAVGDAAFRAKCFKRIGRMAADSAIVFVSHDASQVARICDRALVMDRGTPRFAGETRLALEHYQNLRPENKAESTLQLHEDITRCFITLPDVQRGRRFESGDPLTIVIDLDARRQIATGVSLLNFVDDYGTPVAQVDITHHITGIPAGANRLTIQLARVDLADGTYRMNLALFGDRRRETIAHAVGGATLRVHGDAFLWVAYKVQVATVDWTPTAVTAS